jgi:hypothetical protein
MTPWHAYVRARLSLDILEPILMLITLLESYHVSLLEF